eukprot:3936071-Prymnesium_polylepis.1
MQSVRPGQQAPDPQAIKTALGSDTPKGGRRRSVQNFVTAVRRNSVQQMVSKATRELSRRMSAVAEKPQGVHIRYSSVGGVSRLLELRMSEKQNQAWVTGLQALISVVPHVASPAHWRW